MNIHTFHSFIFPFAAQIDLDTFNSKYHDRSYFYTQKLHTKFKLFCLLS